MDHPDPATDMAHPYDVAIAGSWRQRGRIRAIAQYLRDALFVSVFDFSDASTRPADAPVLPPEAAPLQWAPDTAGRMAVSVAPDGRLLAIDPRTEYPRRTAKSITYGEYLARHRPGVAATMAHNRAVYGACRVAVLVLPAGCDAHWDAGLAVGRGAKLVVYGYPPAGERVPSHLAAAAFVTDGLDRLAEAVRGCLG